MILEVLVKVASVFGENRSETDPICKFCYGDDEQNGWLRPCKCSGTLQWVHRSCFDLWMNKAPAAQQDQCQTCRYVYEKVWVLKPTDAWTYPSIQFSAWECFEILLDTYSAFKLIRGFWWMIQGKRSFWIQCLHFIFWRTFIGTDRRFAYYRSIGVLLLSSIFEIQIKDYEGESEADPSLRAEILPELPLEAEAQPDQL